MIDRKALLPQLWSISLGPPVPAGTFAGYTDIIGPIGIVSTPVVDRTNRCSHSRAASLAYGVRVVQIPLAVFASFGGSWKSCRLLVTLHMRGCIRSHTQLNERWPRHRANSSSHAYGADHYTLCKWHCFAWYKADEEELGHAAATLDDYGLIAPSMLLIPPRAGPTCGPFPN